MGLIAMQICNNDTHAFACGVCGLLLFGMGGTMLTGKEEELTQCLQVSREAHQQDQAPSDEQHKGPLSQQGLWSQVLCCEVGECVCDNDLHSKRQGGVKGAFCVVSLAACCIVIHTLPYGHCPRCELAQCLQAVRHAVEPLCTLLLPACPVLPVLTR